MRVTFEKMQDRDLEMVREWRNRPEISKYMYSDDHISKTDQAKWFEGVRVSQRCEYYIINFDSSPIGLISFTNISKQDKSCEWAFYLTDERAKKTGVAIAAEYLALEHSFNTLKLEKLKCAVLGFNEKIIALHKKFGFSEVDIHYNALKKGPDVHDIHYLEITHDHWQQCRERFEKHIKRF